MIKVPTARKSYPKQQERATDQCPLSGKSRTLARFFNPPTDENSQPGGKAASVHF